ncbi:MAG: hypothetical protein F6K36_22925 [Symploca sp. SIO3C6]|nr:hypothetical protein [Symploca sp. SIO3C6]
MLQIGNYIVNENAIAYVELNAKFSKFSGEVIKGVRIYFLVSNHKGYMDGSSAPIPESLFFDGEQAKKVREYFLKRLTTASIK